LPRYEDTAMSRKNLDARFCKIELHFNDLKQLRLEKPNMKLKAIT
jgi:hypothetical protein